MTRKFIILAAVGLALSGCSSVGGEGFGYGGYSLVRPRSTNVGDGSMAVTRRSRGSCLRPR